MREEARKAAETALILIVDDDEIVRMIMRDQLEAAGYRVEEAADGLEDRLSRGRDLY